MSYVKVTNDEAEIYSIGHLRRDNPNVSFPRNPSNELLAKWDVYPLEVKPEPSKDDLTETTAIRDPELVDGKWIRDWDVNKLEENAASAKVRMKRNEILETKVDTINPLRWEAMDEMEKELWKNYRQKLLDLPLQTGFPFSVSWPVSPTGE